MIVYLSFHEFKKMILKSGLVLFITWQFIFDF